jgi:hypothetical protein
MAPWLGHPKYVAARERLIQYLQSTKYRFRRLSPVLFLCGGAKSARRDALREYLRKYRPELNLFYAETVWDQIAARGDRNALEMESDLASLADIVVVIVESPGTFAELGAFSISDALRKKLVAIVDKRFRAEESFISTGPLRWVDAESHYAPTIYASFSHILEAADEVEDRIKRIPQSRASRVSDLGSSQKHLLFFLTDLISVIHPATVLTVEYYLSRIAPSLLGSRISVPTLVGLGVAMNLLNEQRLRVDSIEHVFFSPKEPDAIGRPFHHSKLLDLESLRAAHVSVLLSIAEAREVMGELQRLR